MKFHSKPVAEHNEVPLADEGRLETILDLWEDTNNRTPTTTQPGNSCYVVSVINRGERHTQGKLNEILGLVETLGDHVCG
ncbi:MAG: hypothetical protein MJK04_28670, partial [Psychrosphaera sp.]|nr:hypothetical protein [Psychrosphaera sp.]